ncbi:MAG: phytanoyl-CoA dioxygenase family protein [Pseudomonadales bacterium]
MRTPTNGAIEMAGCSLSDLLAPLSSDGAVVIPGVFDPEQVAWARRVVLEHGPLMANTRAAPSSRHMAGFHRFPEFEPLHLMLTQSATVSSVMKHLCGDRVRTIGLSDITVNRSQQWHKDLLRGRFRVYLGEGPYCAAWHGTVFKLIVYLQDSTSLKIVPGSHREDIDLASDDSAIPIDESTAVALPAKAGDAVIIDICTTHRGSPETAFTTREVESHPKILVSTVFGRFGAPLTNRMEVGNAARLESWTSQHLEKASPRLTAL